MADDVKELLEIASKRIAQLELQAKDPNQNGELIQLKLINCKLDLIAAVALASLK